MVFGFKLINNVSSQPESIMSEDESKVAKKLEELSQQVKSLRRTVIGLAVFFVTLVCLLLVSTPSSPAIFFAAIAVGIYSVLVALGNRFNQPKVKSNDES